MIDLLKSDRMVIDICLGFFYHVVETLSIVVSNKIILICAKKGNPGYLLSRVEVFSIQPEGAEPDPASAPHSAGGRHANGAPEGGKLLLSDKNFRYAQRKRQLAQLWRPGGRFQKRCLLCFDVPSSKSFPTAKRY